MFVIELIFGIIIPIVSLGVLILSIYMNYKSEKSNIWEYIIPIAGTIVFFSGVLSIVYWSIQSGLIEIINKFLFTEI